MGEDQVEQGRPSSAVGNDSSRSGAWLSPYGAPAAVKTTSPGASARGGSDGETSHPSPRIMMWKPLTG
nr:hypothetical protein [Cryptosporangium arvum]